MHKSYHLLSFDKCIHVYNSNLCQCIKHYHRSRKFPHALPQSNPALL